MEKQFKHKICIPIHPALILLNNSGSYITSQVPNYKTNNKKNVIKLNPFASSSKLFQAKHHSPSIFSETKHFPSLIYQFSHKPNRPCHNSTKSQKEKFDHHNSPKIKTKTLESQHNNNIKRKKQLKKRKKH